MLQLEVNNWWIVCPPELLNMIPAGKGQELQLFHYVRDLLLLLATNVLLH